MQGILFTEPMFNAIIEGRKTQTRRIINPQPDSRGFRSSNTLFEDWHGTKAKPRYKPGETVYLKEPYIDDLFMDEIFYKFNPDDRAKIKNHIPLIDNPWKNKLFMPAEAARYFISITDVKAERVADISEEDAIAEGVEKINQMAYKDYYSQEIDYNLGYKISKGTENDYGCESAYLSFRSLWNSINNKWKKEKDGVKRRYPFDEINMKGEKSSGALVAETIPNPWVWAYEFELLK